MFKNYSKHVYKPMNGQVIASPFWFASVGNCSSIMTLWKEVVVNKLSGEFCLTEILLEKNRKSGRNLKISPLQTIKLNKTWSRGIFDIMLFSRNSVCSFFFFLHFAEILSVYIPSDVLYSDKNYFKKIFWNLTYGVLLDQQIKLIFILFMKYYIMLRLWYLVQQMLFENVWTINIYWESMLESCGSMLFFHLVNWYGI